MQRNFIKNIITWVIVVFVLLIVCVKAYKSGTDINVYLYASQQFSQGESIYSNNPYNDYLYSPLFALLLRPLSLFDFPIARVIWALINVWMTYRMWTITDKIIRDSSNQDPRLLNRWNIGLFIITIGVWLHNLNLGQITVVILWLTFEGLYQILMKGRNIPGAALIALGINIKIIPGLVVAYLIATKKIKAAVYTCLFAAITLFLPALFIGWDHNTQLLTEWKNKINPAGNKYLFEKSNGSSSLNAIIPAFFHVFPEPEDVDVYGFKRKIAILDDTVLLVVIQASRLLLLCSFLFLLIYSRRYKERNPLFFYWEFSYLMMMTILFFPHQMKYSLLLFVPAGSYLLFYALTIIKNKIEVTKNELRIAWIALALLAIFSFTGRDIIGRPALKIVDYYHVTGMIVLLCLPLMIAAKPGRLLDIFNKNTPIKSDPALVE